MTKNKIIISLVVLVIAIGGAIGASYLSKQKATQGAKTVTVHIVSEELNIDVTYTWNTDQEYLFGLLEEHTDDIQLVYETNALYGNMVTGLEGYVVTSTDNNHYWAISVNGEEAMVGISSIAVNDGDVYDFILISYKI